jgi:hypothetical protein
MKRNGTRKGAAAFLTALALIAVFAAGAFAAQNVKARFQVTHGAGLRIFEKVQVSEGGTVDDNPDTDDYLKTPHFYPFKELTAGLAKQDYDGSGYDVYAGTLEILSGQFHYLAGGGSSGFLKQAQVLYTSSGEDVEMSLKVDVGPLDRGLRVDNGFMADDVYFNVNDAQHLVLEVGKTFRLIPIRVWQAMEGVTGNYFIEPDYKVEILGDAGAVAYEWGGSPGLEWAELKGLKKGVAVARITYDPIKLVFDDGGSGYFNAILPINTGIVVINAVDDEKSAAASDIKTNIKAREYDTVYFNKKTADHAEYTFTPTGGGELSVRAHKPIHEGASAWGSAWSDARENGGGGFTVNLYEGRNIIEVSSNSSEFKAYHVINAKGITISITNDSNPAWQPGGELKAGDQLEIGFDGIKTPLEKIGGIYNPGFPNTCYVSYTTQDGGEARGTGVQYNLSERNAVTAAFPSSGTLKLTNGVIHCDHMGDPLGSHRTRPGNEPVYPNFQAVNVAGVYSVMPDITIGLHGEEESGGSENVSGGSGSSGGGGGCDAGPAGLFVLLLILALPFLYALNRKHIVKRS